MKVAVIGAGFSGLSVSIHLLLKGIQVDLYDEKGVGAGASGVSSGLMHPYPGEKAKRSWRAAEAMAETHKLLDIAQKYSKQPVKGGAGILRKITLEQREVFLKHLRDYKDVELIGDDHVRIQSGIVVHSLNYLQGLYQACLDKGMNSYFKKVHSSCELAEYDAFILAIGAGVFTFPGLEDLKLSPTRGQALVCKWPFAPLKEAYLGKGHIVPLPTKPGEGNKVNLGATYEKTEIGKEPCLETALALLKPKAAVLAPEWKEIEVLECKAGTRVSRPSYAVPWIYKINDKGYALTAMGSRGLLYHAYFAKELVNLLIELN
jgi:glycine/D-amino acid oxidase-like deaminating enzyme